MILRFPILPRKAFSDERGLPFYCQKIWLLILDISEYLARFGIEVDPSVTERSLQSGKKHVWCMLGLLSTIIRGREHADQKKLLRRFNIVDQ